MRRHAVDENGVLTLGGISAITLAAQYGTPLYVYEEEKIRAACRALKQALPDGSVHYAGKAMCNEAIVRIMRQEGLGLDITSCGELYIALRAGMNPSSITFHGNNKTPAEIDEAVKRGVGLFAVDNPAEPARIAEACRRYGKRQRVVVRVNLAIDSQTHAYLQTSIVDCKFGFSFYDGSAMSAIKEILSLPELELAGLSCHLGSQIMAEKPYEQAVRKMAGAKMAVERDTGVKLPMLVLGGGFGIRYTSKDNPPDPADYVRNMRAAMADACQKAGMDVPMLAIEPGRSIIGEAGTTLYTIGGVRKQGGRTYLSVDGGMGDNPRPMLYHAEYEAALAANPNGEATENVRVAGRFCETGDVLIEDIALPEARPGDILAVFATGAYNYAMASNYNCVPIPAAILVSGGQTALIAKRQTYEQVAQNQVVPDWLMAEDEATGAEAAG